MQLHPVAGSGKTSLIYGIRFCGSGATNRDALRAVIRFTESVRGANRSLVEGVDEGITAFVVPDIAEGREQRQNRDVGATFNESADTLVHPTTQWEVDQLYQVYHTIVTNESLAEAGGSTPGRPPSD